MKNFYICIMGEMGSGKTTAARILAQALKFKLIEENFGENAFLPKFYQDMKRWAFHSQTFFLMEKITQVLEAQRLLARERGIVQDTPIQQDAFSYAKAQHVIGNIDNAEWGLYQKIYHSFEPNFPKPDLLIYLETSIPAIRSRISSRGRAYEKKIPVRYLKLLQTLNHTWLKSYKNIPLLRVQTDTLNFAKHKRAQKKFVDTVKRALKFSP